MSLYDIDQLKPLFDEDGNLQYNQHNIMIMEDGLPYAQYVPPKPYLTERNIQKLRPNKSKKEYEKLQPLLDEEGKASWDINGLIILEDGLPCMRPEDRNVDLLPKPYVRLMDGLTPDPVISDEQAGKIAEAFIASEKKNAEIKNDNKYDEDGLLKMKKDIREC